QKFTSLEMVRPKAVSGNSCFSQILHVHVNPRIRCATTTPMQDTADSAWRSHPIIALLTGEPWEIRGISSYSCIFQEPVDQDTDLADAPRGWAIRPAMLTT